MDFNAFIEIFFEDDAIDNAVASCSFVRYLRKFNPGVSDFAQIFAEEKHHDLIFDASVKLGYIELLEWLTDQKTGIDKLEQIVSLENIKLLGKFISRLPKIQHLEIMNRALKTDCTNPQMWATLWSLLATKSSSPWVNACEKTITHLSTSRHVANVYAILEKVVGRNHIKNILNGIDILHLSAQYADRDSFCWLWQRTLRKPFSNKMPGTRKELSILGFALVNANSDVFQFLTTDISSSRKLFFKELWYTPRQLRSAYEFLFESGDLSWQEKFMKFKMLHHIIEGNREACCPNCDRVHKINGSTERHLFADRILLSPIDSLEQFEQALGWLREIHAIIHWDVVKNAYKFLKQKCDLLHLFIPLVEGKFRYKIITWGLIVPFGGCARSRAFQQLSDAFKPRQSWWYGMLAPLFIQERDNITMCQTCGDKLSACLDHRISWWMGHGFNINGKMVNNNVLATAINMEISQESQYRLVLAGADVALAHQLVGVARGDKLPLTTAGPQTTQNKIHTKQLKDVLEEFFKFVSLQLS